MKNKITLVLAVVVISGCAVQQREFRAESHAKAKDLVKQGVLQLRSGDYPGAEATFALAWEVQQLAAALDGLGCVAYMEGELKRAENYFLAAIKFDPKYGAARANLALLYDITENDERALALYQEALSLSPENASARNNLAAALYEQNDATPSAATLELLKAKALVSHPIISGNIVKLKESETWSSEK